MLINDFSIKEHNVKNCIHLFTLSILSAVKWHFKPLKMSVVHWCGDKKNSYKRFQGKITEISL